MYLHTTTSRGMVDETGVPKSAIAGWNEQRTRHHSRGCPADRTLPIPALTTSAQQEHPGAGRPVEVCEPNTQVPAGLAMSETGIYEQQ